MRQERIRRELNPAPKRDLVYEVFSKPLYWFLGALVLAALSCAWCLMYPPLPSASVAASLVYGLLLTTGLISLLTWLFFWSKLSIISPYWAVSSFLFPGLLYRYLILYFNEHKIVVFVHGGSVILSALLACFLADLMDLTVFEVLLLSPVQPHEAG